MASTEAVTTQRTPTPWKAVGEEVHDRETHFDSSGARIGDTANLIARIQYPYASHAGRKANADFIVRACNAHDDLLAALREVMQWIASWDPSFTDDEDWDDTYTRVIAAIDKAEGTA